MGFDANIEILRITFWQIIMTAGPLLAVALAIGLLVGIIQAATSINEMTLSFVPKLVVVIFTFGMLSTFMLNGSAAATVQVRRRTWNFLL